MRDRTAGFRNLDLTEIAREVVELFDPAAEENGVTLQLSASDRVDVVGDRDLLFDAISNLVDNAIKHGGSKIGVTIAVSQSAGGLLLSVADGGPGIPVDERNHVLRRFYRLERSRSSPGNGLGLSLVAAVASLHGARIEMVNNSPGLRGSNCIFQFREGRLRHGTRLVLAAAGHSGCRSTSFASGQTALHSIGRTDIMKHLSRSLASAATVATCLISASAAPADDGDQGKQPNRYAVSALVSDVPIKNMNPTIDPVLRNAWGVAFTPAASPFWIADNASGCATL